MEYFEKILMQARMELDSAVAEYKKTGDKSKLYLRYEHFAKGQK